MHYELNEFLLKAKDNEIEMLLECIVDGWNFTEEKNLRTKFQSYKDNLENRNFKKDLIQDLEKEMRYVASSNIAYSYRLMSGKKVAGISILDMLEDVDYIFGKEYKPKLGNLVSYEEMFLNLVRDKLHKDLKTIDVNEQYNILKPYLIAELGKKKTKKYLTDQRNKGQVVEAVQHLIGQSQLNGLMQKIVAEHFKKNNLLLESSKLFTLVVAFLKKEITKRFMFASLGIIATGLTIYCLQRPDKKKTLTLLLLLCLIALRIEADKVLNNNG